jgi:DNA polymerase-4
MSEFRKIIHIDMDAFYASVEQLDHPELVGKPVIVGGRPDSRGVVAACSYEARKFGVKSAMPCAHAYRLCPQAVFIRPRLNRYRELSAQIMEIFTRYTDIIEPLSLDEAYLDVTINKQEQPSATLLARQICSEIHDQTGLTASAGVSCNKFVAKIASGLHKPNGISVIKPDQIETFLAGLPIGKFHGIGTVTETKMLQLNIRTGADLKACSEEELTAYFGKNGRFFYDIVRGIDPRPVMTSRQRKSVGAERTLSEDTSDLAQIHELLVSLTRKVCTTLENKSLQPKTITLKIRYGDFTTITRSVSLTKPPDGAEEIIRLLPGLVRRTRAGSTPVRLVGISVSNFHDPAGCRPTQMTLPYP